MPANTDAIWTRKGNILGVAITAANTSSQGGVVGTSLFLAFQGDATNGSKVDRVRFMPTASAPTTTTATVARVFVASTNMGTLTAANC